MRWDPNAVRAKDLSEYKCWAAMVQRCSNPKNPDYKNYGGRGILLCDQWRRDFWSFYNHIGPRPTLDHTIDRIITSGNYEPGNVRWLTRAKQNRNKRNGHDLTLNGVTMSMTEWAEKVGLSRGVIKDRLATGWTVENALTKPVATEVWNKHTSPIGAWGTGRKPPACLGHGGTDSPHVAKGLCRKCYGAKWEQNAKATSSSRGPR